MTRCFFLDFSWPFLTAMTQRDLAILSPVLVVKGRVLLCAAVKVYELHWGVFAEAFKVPYKMGLVHIVQVIGEVGEFPAAIVVFGTDILK